MLKFVHVFIDNFASVGRCSMDYFLIIASPFMTISVVIAESCILIYTSIVPDSYGVAWKALGMIRQSYFERRAQAVADN
jgi:hypothetical protein